MGLQVLDDVEVASADADTALAAIGTLERVIAHAQAMQMAWMNRFLDHRLAPGSRYSKYAAAEVAAELTWSTQTADKRLSLAYQLGSTLQRTWGAMYLGEIDLTKARALADIIAPLDVDKARLVEDEVLPKAGERTVRWVRDKARKQVLKIDPDGAEARRKERAKERRVEKSPDDDGMSWLNAYLPADKVEAAYRRVDAIAHSLKAREDPRSLDEVRADVLIDLLLGNPSNVTTKIEVRVDAMTLMGCNNNPADLPGYGPISAEYAKELAFQPGSFWYRFLTDPLSGIVIDHGRTRYRPPVALRDLVKARDVRCCGVGCYRPAASCEIDHSLPYPYGKTADNNLAPACKYHNLSKLHGWTVQQTSPGHFTWKSPTGRTYTVDPENDPAPLGPPPF